MTPGELPDDAVVTVCASCLRASCWNYIFLCDNHKTANITTRTVGELRKLDREHPDYFARSKP